MNITTWESNVNVNVSVDVRTEPPWSFVNICLVKYVFCSVLKGLVLFSSILIYLYDLVNNFAPKQS